MDTKGLIAAALLCAALAGCGTAGGGLCAAGPFIADPGAAERWTRGEKEQAVTLNRAGERICGWRAPG
jgi:hypothetical protein